MRVTVDPWSLELKMTVLLEYFEYWCAFYMEFSTYCKISNLICYNEVCISTLSKMLFYDGTCYFMMGRGWYRDD